MLKEALEASVDTVGVPYGSILATLAQIHQDLGDLPSAIARLHAALAATTQDEMVIPKWTVQLAELYRLSGKAWEARELMQAAQDLCHQRKWFMTAESLRQQVKAELAPTRPVRLLDEGGRAHRRGH